MDEVRITGSNSPVMNALKQWVFLLVHLSCLLALWTGVSWVAFGVCMALYFIRMFAITGGYHRYFSHRSYKTSRVFQFILGWVGAMSAQKGPLWWASHHRHHHQYSDTEHDIHSPIRDGVWWAHVGWIISPHFVKDRPELVRDLRKFPELLWLDKYNLLPPVILAVALFFFGKYLGAYHPELGTNGPQMLVWGFFISTVLTYHGTFLVNSATHLFGKKRFETGDHSKNSLLIALVTLGEGWHNNHHRYPGSEQQGFYWWEIDISHYMLKVLSWFGVVWDLRSPPQRIYDEARARKESLAKAA